jgi:hypothetical protein
MTSSCNQNQINCLNNVLDCQHNDISINNQCYNVQKKTGPNNDPIRFNVMNPDQSFDPTKTNNWANFENVSVTNCLQKCSNHQSCDGVQFSFGTDENNDEFNSNGYCQLYTFNGEQPIKSKSPPKPAPLYKYSSLYTKKYSKSKSRGYISNDYTITNQTANPDNPTSLQIKKSNIQDVPNITKIYSKYQGAICRNDIKTPPCNLLNSYLNNWCAKNEDSSTCETYCNFNSSNCPSRNTTGLITYSVLVAVTLFLIVLSFKTKKLTLFKIGSLIAFSIFTVLFVLHIIRFTKPVYDGTQPEILPDWYSPNSCQNGQYKNVLGKCVSQNLPTQK